MQTSSAQRLTEIEAVCRTTVKHKLMTDEIYAELAKWVVDETPTHYNQFVAQVLKYLPKNMATESAGERFADELVELKLLQKVEKVAVDSAKQSALQKAKQREAENEQRKMDAKMAAFLEKKGNIPAPEVRHEKGNNFIQDINLNFTLIVGGQHLIEDANLKLVQGRKYGLVGRNGIGKTQLIDAISRHEIEGFPSDIHSLQVEQEVEGDERTVLEHILACDVERTALMKEYDELMSEVEKPKTTKGKGKGAQKGNSKGARLAEISERLVTIQAVDQETKAIEILTGIGFSQTDLHKASKDFSGGWRMRIAIAKVIFCEPEILMLDEPTNHLDLPALIWLENYIQTLDITVIIVSHARDFLNACVDEIIHFQGGKLTYYSGNFDQFVKTKAERDKNQAKQREGQLEKIAHIKEFVDKFRANKKRSTMVQSRIKTLEKMEVADEVFQDPECRFEFPDPEDIGPNVMRLDMAKIGYPGGEPILRNVDINVDCETRIALIGPNGAGKSTLVKALCGKLEIQDGQRSLNGKVRVGIFTQHHTDSLDLRLSALEQMIAKFPEFKPVEALRAHLGSFGLSGPLALRPMYLLSGGQKSRVSFALITFERPHVLMLDEPTNHLDYDAINALIVGLNNYEGGLVVVSHDEYFLNALCDRLYLVQNGEVKPFQGDLKEYRKIVTKELGF